jgi:hypothetical protein
LERADESPECGSLTRGDGHVEGGQEVEVKRKREVHMQKGIKWSLIQVKGTVSQFVFFVGKLTDFKETVLVHHKVLKGQDIWF